MCAVNLRTGQGHLGADMARKWFVLGKFAGLCGFVSLSAVLTLSQVAYSADATVTVNVTLPSNSLVTLSATGVTPTLYQSKTLGREGQLHLVRNASGRTLGFTAEGQSLWNVSIFETNGSMVTTLYGNGTSQAMFVGKQLSSGVYMAKTKINNLFVTTSFVK